MPVLWGILLLILLLLLIPVRIKAHAATEEPPEVVMWVLMFPVRLVPGRDSSDKRRRKKHPSSGESGKSKKQIHDLKRFAAGLLPYLSHLCAPVQRLLRRTGVARVSLRFVVTGEDAAQTAIRFGQVNAAVYFAVAVLDRIVSLRVDRIEILPGFTAPKEQYAVCAEARIFPFAVLIAGLQIGFWILAAALRAGQRPEKSENRRAASAG